MPDEEFSISKQPQIRLGYISSKSLGQTIPRLNKPAPNTARNRPAQLRSLSLENYLEYIATDC